MKLYQSIAVLVAFLCSLLYAGAATTKKAKTEADDLFAQPKVLEIKIEIPSASIESLKNDPHKYVRGVVREGSRVFSDAGIRLKGSGSFQPIEKKPSLAIKFNEFISGSKFYGHSKLFLDNSRQDPTFLCEAIGGDIFRAAGVPAPRHTFAHVELNGRDLGLYVVAEAVNKEFLSKYFSRTKGNLYEGSNVDITEKLEKDSGDESQDQKDVKALAAAAKEADPATRLKKLNGLLDVDRFVSFTAAEIFTWHRDGYALDRNNYRIYNDPGTNQIVFIPHGFDQLFGKPKGSLFPEWKGLVAKAIISTPEGKAKYKERMSKLLTSAFKTDTITNRINQLSAVVKPMAGRDSTQGPNYENAVAQLRARVLERAAFLEEELKKAGN